MFAEIVANTPIVIFPVVGLVLFFGFMVGVYFWAFSPRNKQAYLDIAQSILND